MVKEKNITVRCSEKEHTAIFRQAEEEGHNSASAFIMFHIRNIMRKAVKK